MSGMRPSTTTVYHNRDDYKPHVLPQQTLNSHFRANGYRTVGAGKIYHGGGGRRTEWDDYATRPRNQDREAYSRNNAGGIRWAQLKGGDDVVNDYHTVSYCIDQLEADHDRPFFLACGIFRPHMPWSVPKTYFDMHPLAEIQLPPHIDDDLADLPVAGVKTARPKGDHKTVTDKGLWKEAIQAYLASITYADAQLGRLLDALDKSRYDKHTIVVLWGDHGWHLGEKQHWRKFALWEEATRAPLIWVVPGVTPQGVICERTVDFMSIYPTLCELAGLEIPNHCEGPSIVSLLRNPQAEWNRPAVTTHGRNRHAVRSSEYRYIQYEDGSEELYDEIKDPFEWMNLATDPAYSTTISELQKWIPKQKSPPTSDDMLRYEQFALRHSGDAAAGRKLFESDKAQCADCHRISGMEKSGPNLDGLGEKYDRAALIEHILDPSSTVMPGFEQATVFTNDGRSITGRFERATKVEVRIIDATGKQTNLKRDEVEEIRYSSKSMMPDNLIATISQVEFSDLIAYLSTLRFGVKNGWSADGVVTIPHLDKPIEFKPIQPKHIQFQNPVWCGALPGQPGSLIVLEHQEAKAWRFDRDSTPPRKELFLDLSSELHVSPNQGLMCLTFHPKFEQNRRYFLEYEVKEDDKIKTLVVERRVAEDGLHDSGDPSIRLLEVVQPAFNHNGGCIAFGPDGMLYAAFGDGGPQRDPEGYSQDPTELKGSFVRIDVDHPDGQKRYSIPRDNPFLAAHQENAAVRPETWAIGFREPWRFSFDRVTGDLWVGDVGQDTYEEVALVRAGENHGWNVREGFAPFSQEYQRDSENYTDPLFVYEHGLGFSVTGGHVYRGDPNSSFYGVYIFGDYNTRRVWGLRQENGRLVDVRELGTAPGGIASFGLDHRGEILLVTYSGQMFYLDLSATSYDSLDSANLTPRAR